MFQVVPRSLREFSKIKNIQKYHQKSQKIIEIGDKNFEDFGAFFDLPQGDRWIADKEIVPLSGELPGMALGLMKSLEKNKLYWRVIGRRSTGEQAISGIRSFSIKPVTGG